MSNITTEDNSRINIINEQRRKRINRIKIIIITLGILFLILPTIFCVILSVKVIKLQNQVNKMAVLYDKEDVVNEDESFANIAYAAEKPSQELNKESTEQTNAEANNDDVTTDNNENHNSNIITDSNNYVTAAESSELSDTFENPDAGTGISGTNEAGLEDKSEETKKDALNGVSDDKKSNKSRYKGKKVYLTFDDGPSIYTADILDILKEYGVKATFFVIGKTDSASKKMYKRIVEDGHTLGMHSYSHKYDIIYNSLEDFDKDFTKLWKLLYDTTGLEPTLYRFPGGSANKVNKNGMDDFIRYLNEKSIVYFDWNALNGDATGIKYSEEQLIANVLNGVNAKKNSIVLMHDAASKEATVKTLPELLDKLLSGGAELYPLDTNVTPIQMIKANSIN